MQTGKYLSVDSAPRRTGLQSNDCKVFLSDMHFAVAVRQILRQPCEACSWIRCGQEKKSTLACESTAWDLWLQSWTQVWVKKPCNTVLLVGDFSIEWHGQMCVECFKVVFCLWTEIYRGRHQGRLASMRPLDTRIFSIIQFNTYNIMKWNEMK